MIYRVQRTSGTTEGGFPLLHPQAPIYEVGSKAERVSYIVGVVSVLCFVVTIGLTVFAVSEGHKASLLVAGLAMAWAVGAPAWFWYEYFFIYREAGLPGSFELYKHGQQVSLAIWPGWLFH